MFPRVARGSLSPRLRVPLAGAAIKGLFPPPNASSWPGEVPAIQFVIPAQAGIQRNPHTEQPLIRLAPA